ncbi:hypothetical protein MIR68_011923 [Amoeboaphelidium protococcarum]|nr:hypothetical protein MIR68_011923 [Amoeboaphelidium protococcarum]
MGGSQDKQAYVLDVDLIAKAQQQKFNTYEKPAPTTKPTSLANTSLRSRLLSNVGQYQFKDNYGQGSLQLLPPILQTVITLFNSHLYERSRIDFDEPEASTIALHRASRKSSAGSFKLRRVTLHRVLQWSGDPLVDKFDGQRFSNRIKQHSATLEIIRFSAHSLSEEFVREILGVTWALQNVKCITVTLSD